MLSLLITDKAARRRTVNIGVSLEQPGAVESNAPKFWLIVHRSLSCVGVQSGDMLFIHLHGYVHILY